MKYSCRSVSLRKWTIFPFVLLALLSCDRQSDKPFDLARSNASALSSEQAPDTGAKKTEANPQAEKAKTYADFRVEPRMAAVGEPVHFFDQSYPGIPEIDKWLWKFGDGHISQEPNTEHVYASPGDYDISLEISSPADKSHSVRNAWVSVRDSSMPPPEKAALETGISLEPEGRGSFVAIRRRDCPEAFCRLRAPESVNWPRLVEGDHALVVGPLNWRKEGTDGTLSYSFDTKEAVFTAVFEPHSDHVSCTYSTQLKPGFDNPPQLSVNPCQQLGDSIFDGRHDDLQRRIHFLSGGKWKSVAECPDAGIRSMIFFMPHPSKPASPDELSREITSATADMPVMACVSRDGKWICATAVKTGDYLFCNTLPNYRCLHTPASSAFDGNGYASVCINVYLFKGTLDDLRAKISNGQSG